MANQLGVAKVHSILTLHEQGHSFRQIAGMLGVHRETVARHVHLARGPDEDEAKPSTEGQAPTGSDRSKPAAPTGSEDGQTASVAGEAPPGRAGASQCEPWRDVIVAKLEQGLSAVRIHQDLVEMGPAGASGAVDVPSYYSVRRFVRQLGAGSGSGLPFRRMECAPGQECQVDFGTGAPIVNDQGRRRRRRPHVLRIVLSHSRKGYSEAVYRQTTEDFIRCLENAFWHFGGVPRTMVLDNLRAAVSQADWFDPELNPKVQSFCAHYGIVALPTKPRMPRHKGKVERGIDYVKDNGLKGHVFDSLEAENAHLRHWETHVADTRIHGTTRKQVQQLFEQAEKPALQPLPLERFPFFHEGRRTVHRDGHVEVEKAYYSVPPEYVGRQVWARWDGRTVRVFNGRMEQIAYHVRKEPGRFSTQDRHIASAKINGVEQGAAKLLERVRLIGPQAGRWSEAMLQARGIAGVRVLLGLLSLSNKHAFETVDRACGVAASHGAYRLRSVRKLIARTAPAQQELPFIDEHPIIRSLSDYDDLVKTSFQTTPGITDKEHCA